MQTKRLCLNPSHELCKGLGWVLRCPSNLHRAAQLRGVQQVGNWITNSGHHCGEVWHQNIFTGGLIVNFNPTWVMIWDIF